MSLNYNSQTSFAAGEIAPSLHARTDLAKYATGLKIARNGNVLPQGGFRNRAGTYKVAVAGDSTHAVRNVPFVYSSGQAYNLEFGEEYIRFFKDDAPVAGTASAWTYPTSYYSGDYVTYGGHVWLCILHDVSSQFNFPGSDPTKWVVSDYYQIGSPYLGTELFNLKFTQSADYLYIFHPLHAPMQLVRKANNSWVLSQVIFRNGPFMLSNTDIYRTLTPSGDTVLYNAAHTISTVIANESVPGVVNTTSYVKLVTSVPHGLLSGDIVVIASLDGALGWHLNGKKFFIEVVDSTSFYLCRYGTIIRIYFNGISSYTPGAGTASSQGLINLTSNFPIFATGHEGALFELVETIQAETVTDATFTGMDHNSISIKCGSTWRLKTTGTWGGIIIVQMSTDNGATWNNLRTLSSSGNGTILASNYDTSGDTGASQCLIRVYQKPVLWWYGTLTINLTSDTFDWHGIVKINSITNANLATAKIISEQGVGIGLASTTATFQWAERSWSTYRGFPTCGIFYQDRFCPASTATEPQTVWMSQTGDYTNYGVSAPLVDSDAMSVLLPSRTVNIVKNMAVLGELVVLTSDSDFSIQPGSNGNLSPTSILITCHGHRGSSAVSPAIVGNELILVQQMGTVVRNLIYQFSVSGYMGDDIIVMAKHLLTGHTIVEMAFQQEPDSILWAVRDDGKLLSLTYMREQEMLAWSLHDTDGLFESVSVIPNSTLGIDEVWFVVNRGGVRFIERLAKRDMGEYAKDYMMLDCAVTQNNGASPLATVTGLDHLDGKTVNALVDGFVVKDLVVASGSVTLPIPVTLAHVGLPYVSDLETLRIDSPTNNGTAQSRRIAIPEVTIRFVDSRGGWVKAMAKDIDAPAATGVVGFDENLEHDSNQNMSVAMPLKTTDYKMTLNGGYDFGAGVFFRQVDPLPFTIIAIIPKVIVSEN